MSQNLDNVLTEKWAIELMYKMWTESLLIDCVVSARKRHGLLAKVAFSGGLYILSILST